jgi:hypothetical protein
MQFDKRTRIIFVWCAVSACIFWPNAWASQTAGESGAALHPQLVGKVDKEKSEAELFDEKLARLKGEKVTILGTQPLHCPATPSDEKVKLFYSADDREQEHRLPLNKYAGQTGIIVDAKRVGKVTSLTSVTNDIVIQLDKAEGRIVAKDESGLGFHSELESAKELTGKSLWTKSKYTTLAPTSDSCKYFSEDQRLRIKKLQKLTVIRVEFGDYEHPVIIFAKTDDGQEGQIYPFQKNTFYDEKFHGLSKYSYPDYFSRTFLFEDPRKTHPSWGNAIWKLIEEGEVAIGMTEEMVKLACVESMVDGKLQEKGFVLSPSGDEMSPICECSGKKFILEKGKVTKYVDAR